MAGVLLHASIVNILEASEYERHSHDIKPITPTVTEVFLGMHSDSDPTLEGALLTTENNAVVIFELQADN